MKCGTHARVFSQTLVHGNGKNEEDKETKEEGKKRGVSLERRKRARKRSPDGLSLPNQNIILKKHNMVLFYNLWNSIEFN